MKHFIRWVIARYTPKKELTPHQMIEEALQALREASSEELGGKLAVAMQAKKTLDTTRIVDAPFPLDILDGSTPLDAAARERLDAYVVAMQRFKSRCLSSGTNLSALVANGLDTWIITFLALTLPAMTEGYEMWGLLVRGEATAESAYRFMVRRDLTDLEQEYLAYRPRILLQV